MEEEGDGNCQENRNDKAQRRWIEKGVRPLTHGRHGEPKTRSILKQNICVVAVAVTRGGQADICKASE